MKLNVCFETYSSINMEECINARFSHSLENLVACIVSKYIRICHFKTKKINDSDIPNLLNYVLLQIGNKKTWLDTQANYKLSQRDLYVIIKRRIILHNLKK